MVFDVTEPDIDKSKFQKEDWSAIVCRECSKTLPCLMPEAREVGFTIQTFIDSDHAGDTVTWRS